MESPHTQEQFYDRWAHREAFLYLVCLVNSCSAFKALSGFTSVKPLYTSKMKNLIRPLSTCLLSPLCSVLSVYVSVLVPLTWTSCWLLEVCVCGGGACFIHENPTPALFLSLFKVKYGLGVAVSGWSSGGTVPSLPGGNSVTGRGGRQTDVPRLC